jgi:hypothetical protein
MKICAIVLAAIFLSSCTSTRRGSAFIDPALEMLIPADAVFIIGANVEAIKNTPVYQKLLSQVDLPQLNQFTEQTGLDPRKDLRQVISVSNGKTGLLMARGSFSEGDLATRLESKGAKRMGYKGFNLFGDDRGAVLFINTSTAVAGGTEELRRMIDQRNTPERGLPPALRDQIRALPETDQVWAALTGGLQGLNVGVPQESNLGGVLQALRGIAAIRLGIDLRNGFDAQAEATCQTERDAKHVHDMVKGLVGMGRLSTPDNQPEMLKLYDAIRVTQQQNHTDVTAQIPTEQVDRFLDLWMKKR